jgi:NDP-sugar pyrophosphorylase family protein
VTDLAETTVEELTAVILAGGLGTRLRSVVGDLPKALAPVAGRPFLTYQLNWLKRQGVRRIILCTGYQHERIKAQFGDGKELGLDIRHSVEEHALGTAGALRGARAQLGETFVVLNGDTYLDADLADMLTHHCAERAAATLALKQAQSTGRFGTVRLDKKGYITRFAEKRCSGAGLVNAGAYICDACVFTYFPNQQPLSLELDVFPELARRRILRGYLISGYVCDIGTPESYSQFQRDVEQLRVAKE